MRQDLLDYIQRAILPRYVFYDKAHQLSHIQTVIDESMALAVFYPVDKEMVYTIAAYHDLGICEGREQHHLSSARMLMEDKQLCRWFTPEQRIEMKEAVEDHRASATSLPRSIYGKIVAQADRDINPQHILERTVAFSLDHEPQMSKEEHYRRFLDHLHEKYARGGYLKLPLPQGKNAEQLEQLRLIIENPEQIKCLFDTIYNHLTNSSFESAKLKLTKI